MAVPVQFQDVGSSGSQISFLKFFETTGLVAGQYGQRGELLVDAPVAQVPNEDAACSYVKYYYIDDAYEQDGRTPHSGACWSDKDGLVLPASELVTLGKGFWFRAQCTGASRTTAGQVLDGDTATLTPKSEFWVMLANPFPTPMSLATAVTTGITAGSYGQRGEMLEFAPVIQVPNEDVACSYTKFYYINDAYEQDGRTPHSGSCWADKDGLVISGDQIPVGKSAWFRDQTKTDTPTITVEK